jgi:hypothetical protein
MRNRCVEAAARLARQGIPVPAAPNRFTHWEGGRCLRLGHSEFLIEWDDARSAPSADDLAGDGAYLLLRSDCSIVLAGAPWPDALAQACSFDFGRLRGEPDLVVMTLFAGIGVTLVREPDTRSDSPLALRLWCDASYATYLQQCLQQLAAPLPPGDTT